MAGSNAVPVAVGLLAVITPPLKAAYPDIMIDFAYNGRTPARQYVYVGRIAGPQEPMVFRGGSRLPRQEDITIQLHAEVMAPASSAQDAATVCAGIGTVIEETLAGDPTGASANVAGLMSWTVGRSELTPFYLDEGAGACECVYQIMATSILR